MRIACLLLVAALSGCATMQKPPQLSGTWGGPHVGLVLEGGLGKIQYDCASGTIDTAIVPAADGSFRAEGLHIPGQGGPIRVGQIFKTYRAQYMGTVSGDTITYRAVLENGEVIGPYTVTRGAEPQILRCL